MLRMLYLSLYAVRMKVVAFWEASNEWASLNFICELKIELDQFSIYRA